MSESHKTSKLKEILREAGETAGQVATGIGFIGVGLAAVAALGFVGTKLNEWIFPKKPETNIELNQNIQLEQQRRLPGISSLQYEGEGTQHPVVYLDSGLIRQQSHTHHVTDNDKHIQRGITPVYEI